MNALLELQARLRRQCQDALHSEKLSEELLLAEEESLDDRLESKPQLGVFSSLHRRRALLRDFRSVNRAVYLLQCEQQG